MGVTTIVDTDGEPLRHAVRAEPDVDLAERARGRGARRPRVQRRGGPRHRRARDGRARRARGDHDRCPTAASRCVLVDGAPTLLPRAGSSRARRSRRSARATPSWPATSPRATRAARRGVPALRRRLRRGVDPAPRRRPRRPARDRAAAGRDRGRASAMPRSLSGCGRLAAAASWTSLVRGLKEPAVCGPRPQGRRGRCYHRRRGSLPPHPRRSPYPSRPRPRGVFSSAHAPRIR